MYLTLEEFQALMETRRDEKLMPRPCFGYTQALGRMCGLTLHETRSLAHDGELDIPSLIHRFSDTGDRGDPIWRGFWKHALCLCVPEHFLLTPSLGGTSIQLIDVAQCLKEGNNCIGLALTRPDKAVEYPTSFPIRASYLVRYLAIWRTRELLVPASSFNYALSGECLAWLGSRMRHKSGHLWLQRLPQAQAENARTPDSHMPLNFSSRSDTVFCGVFDGHGPYGHMVAKKVRDSLPVLLCSQWKANSKSDRSENGNATKSSNFEECVDDDWCASLEVEENEKVPEMYLPLKQSMLKAFKLMDKELKFHSAIDCFCSGTTAVALVKQQCKGRVFALQDEPEVARVWLPNSDSPGLAMARAFGDFCLKDFGLISVPDIYYHRLTERDEFIILASDGVWDVLSNKEAVDIVASAPGCVTAARALVDCATRAWRLKYPTSKNDDCAVVCLFLEHVPVPDAAPAENDLTKDTETVLKIISVTNEDTRNSAIGGGVSASDASIIEESGTFKDSGEIVPVLESNEEKLPEKCLGQSRRSLAECLSTGEDEEWSALEVFKLPDTSDGGAEITKTTRQVSLPVSSCKKP
ncbi:hypothetical protein TEA_007942 [Camellia sinensis var. sinensis]|uniref:PPM-type phosphatase domain-containing protein n=1 Tax=Camellia sinensis var. sinensis TaxID=542762 RepID=A0A4S4EX10_CAMSN|nr:hypothetical protein TEA_007942 [Camellia sinensis var. sinensis]